MQQIWSMSALFLFLFLKICKDSHLLTSVIKILRPPPPLIHPPNHPLPHFLWLSLQPIAQMSPKLNHHQSAIAQNWHNLLPSIWPHCPFLLTQFNLCANMIFQKILHISRSSKLTPFFYLYTYIVNLEVLLTWWWYLTTTDIEVLPVRNQFTAEQWTHKDTAMRFAC